MDDTYDNNDRWIIEFNADERRSVMDMIETLRDKGRLPIGIGWIYNDLDRSPDYRFDPNDDETFYRG